MIDGGTESGGAISMIDATQTPSDPWSAPETRRRKAETGMRSLSCSKLLMREGFKTSDRFAARFRPKSPGSRALSDRFDQKPLPIQNREHNLADRIDLIRSQPASGQ